MTWPGRVSPWDGLRLPLGLPENRDGEGCAGRQVPGRGRLTLASLPPRPTGGSRYLNVGKSAQLKHYCQGLTCYLIECHILNQYLWECLFKWSWGQLRALLHTRGLLWNSKKALDIELFQFRPLQWRVSIIWKKRTVDSDACETRWVVIPLWYAFVLFQIHVWLSCVRGVKKWNFDAVASHRRKNKVDTLPGRFFSDNSI